jgi:hypothetical protein
VGISGLDQGLNAAADATARPADGPPCSAEEKPKCMIQIGFIWKPDAGLKSKWGFHQELRCNAQNNFKILLTWRFAPL